MITILAPCDLTKVTIVPGGYWADHVARKGYNKNYAGTDYARAVPEKLPLRPSQISGKVTQAHWSNEGYGYTTFIDYGGILKIRNAHQENVAVKVGQVVGPGDFLGWMDSTGNSTGDHTHFEVWIKRSGVWQNVDPLNSSNEINIVNDPSQLVSLTDEVPEKPIEFKLPDLQQFPKVEASAIVTKWINVRSLPKINSYDLGDLRPREVWEVVGYYEDATKNIWFAVKKDQVIGWIAAYFQGETWVKTLINN